MKKTGLLWAGWLCCVLLFAQNAETPFRKEINAFKKTDSVQMPGLHRILFVGSSSFTKWTDVQQYFSGYPIINRGFGGSSLPDLIRYAPEIIFPYQPIQIVIYCGENDIAAADTITAVMVLQRFQQLFYLIRNQLPNTPLVFISIKPSPSRWKFETVIVETNRMIRKFLRKQSKSSYVNVHDAMLNADGTVKADIFVGDQLHMNAKGYEIWQRMMKPGLKS